MGLKERISQVLLIVAVIQILLSSTSDAAPNRDSKPFEVQLFSKLADANSDKNIFYSPLSIKICLAMIRQGSSGETGRQIEAALTSSGQGHEKMADEYHDILQRYGNSTILSIANKIYAMTGYKAQRSFYNSVTQKFFASMASLDFSRSKASAKSINRWVKDQSDITDLISEDKLDSDTRLVIVNALKFKGKWASAFNPNRTSNAAFVPEDGEPFDVRMMYQSGTFKNCYLWDLEAHVLEMPYEDSNFSMVIVLPRGEKNLSDVEKEFNSIPWTRVEYELYANEVHVGFPKFKLEFKAELSKPLMELGMKRIFSPDAELDKILVADGQAIKGLKVDNIVQKAFIEVDEEGSTAGAATEVGVTSRMGSDDFIADRPFYFFIKDEMNNKIFEGRINKKFSY